MPRIAIVGSPEPFARLNRVPIREIGEPLVDLRDACPDIEFAPGCLPYLRRTVAAMLNRAQDSLPPGYRFRAGSALRTLTMQAEMYWKNYHRLAGEKPHLPPSALRRITNKYFAAPDYPAPPGHTTGAAVDVALILPDGFTADVTSPTKGWEAAYTWSDKIGPEARHNRMIIIDALAGAGFSNCREEWWHWSYGDSAWAVRVGATVAVYGRIEPPDGFTFVPDAEKPDDTTEETVVEAATATGAEAV